MAVVSCSAFARMAVWLLALTVIAGCGLDRNQRSAGVTQPPSEGEAAEGYAVTSLPPMMPTFLGFMSLGSRTTEISFVAGAKKGAVRQVLLWGELLDSRGVPDMSQVQSLFDKYPGFDLHLTLRLANGSGYQVVEERNAYEAGKCSGIPVDFIDLPPSGVAGLVADKIYSQRLYDTVKQIVNTFKANTGSALPAYRGRIRTIAIGNEVNDPSFLCLNSGPMKYGAALISAVKAANDSQGDGQSQAEKIYVTDGSLQASVQITELDDMLSKVGSSQTAYNAVVDLRKKYFQNDNSSYSDFGTPRSLVEARRVVWNRVNKIFASGGSTPDTWSGFLGNYCAATQTEDDVGAMQSCLLKRLKTLAEYKYANGLSGTLSTDALILDRFRWDVSRKWGRELIEVLHFGHLVNIHHYERAEGIPALVDRLSSLMTAKGKTFRIYSNEFGQFRDDGQFTCNDGTWNLTTKSAVILSASPNHSSYRCAVNEYIKKIALMKAKRLESVVLWSGFHDGTTGTFFGDYHGSTGLQKPTTKSALGLVYEFLAKRLMENLDSSVAPAITPVSGSAGTLVYFKTSANHVAPLLKNIYVVWKNAEDAANLTWNAPSRQCLARNYSQILDGTQAAATSTLTVTTDPLFVECP